MFLRHIKVDDLLEIIILKQGNKHNIDDNSSDIKNYTQNS